MNPLEPMMPNRISRPLLLVFLAFLSLPALAQPTWTLDPFGREKKPEKYEEKKLGSEKTADKKFTVPRHVIQNTVTHFNYYFNANNKLNAVIERAKMAHKDNYSKLLSFYPYTLESTAAQAVDLDSIIYKSTAGILLHDLRNDWIDNLYLLIGKSYFFRNTLDSAALTFQFINYNLFPRKKNEDDSRVVGTNQSSQSGAMSISDKEKQNILQKIASQPPSRNDALIWLIRSLTELNEYSDAAGMINILQLDPNLPARLKNDLEEVTAYWFYKQEIYDSAAVHLERALSNAETQQDRARWEFLIGQMYERSGQYEKSSAFFSEAAKHTVDPVMDIFARLNDAKQVKKSGNVQELRNVIENLLKMARKDKYEAYRDIIYYSAGRIGMEIPDTTASVDYYLKSVKYHVDNIEIKHRANLELGHIFYDEALYKSALFHYDSLDLSLPPLQPDSALVDTRRRHLVDVVKQLDIIQWEDSVQMIARMPAAERDAFIKNLSRKMKKDKGSDKEKESKDDSGGGDMIRFANDKNAPADLFESNAKGEWYFNNASRKSKGFNEFKSKWGKRDNVDNWRRRAVSDLNLSKPLNGVSDDPLAAIEQAVAKNGEDASGKALPNSYDGMMANLPLTPEAIDSSNAHIAEALLELARIFQYDLEDHEQAIAMYDIYLQRFPNQLQDGEVYMGLYYCYTKLNQPDKAAYYKNLLNKEFAQSEAAKKINNPLLTVDNKKSPEATARYAAIYDMFLEGRFEQALQEKKSADSLYGDHYWSPQLLYIESVYHIRSSQDSEAIARLNQLIQLYPESPMKEKAETMIDVIRRRPQIQEYLARLEVTRAEEEKFIFSDVQAKPVVNSEPKKEEPKVVKAPVKAPVPPPSAPIVLPQTMVSGGFQWAADKAHSVMMVLEKTDPVYVNEAKNAFTRFNRQKYSHKNIQIVKDALSPEKAILLFNSFADAEEAFRYLEVVRKSAPAEVSWLPAAKYSFWLISENNLTELKKNLDFPAYRQLLNNQYPGKF